MGQSEDDKDGGPSVSRETSDSSSDSRDSSGGVDAWMRALREVAPYLDLGWRLAGSAAGPPLVGYAVDVWLDTVPWGLLIGCLFGLLLVIVQLRRLQQEFGR